MKQIKEKIPNLNTAGRILDWIDKLMWDNLQDKMRKLEEDNLSEALILENYFFALLYLREDILKEDLYYRNELKRLKDKFEK